MSVLRIEAQLTTGQLLKAVEQMPQPELDEFVERVVAIGARHRAPGSDEDRSRSLARHVEVGQPRQNLPPPVEPAADSRDKEIEELYEKLADLRSRENGGADVHAETEGELRATFERLRHLQLQEAAEFRGAAESRLLMPLDADFEIEAVYRLPERAA